MADDVIKRYVRFIFSEWEFDKSGWVTKNPPSIAEFEEVAGWGQSCPHCGEIMRWVDMFNIAWCAGLYWGDNDYTEYRKSSSRMGTHQQLRKVLGNDAASDRK